jgi:hypothetical protein
MEAVLAVAPKPDGFTAQELVDKTRALLGLGESYTPGTPRMICASPGARS